MPRRRGWQEKVEEITLYISLSGGAVIMMIPLLYMVATALKGQVYVFEIPPRFIPEHPTLANFIEAWGSNNFALYFRNSFVVAIATTLASTLLSAMLAYTFARFDFPGKTFTFYLLLFTLMIPSLMLIIPQFLLAKALGLRNSLQGLIFVYVAMTIPLNTFLLRGFFEQLPTDLEEAVLIDGGGYGTIFFRIVLPLSKPALATVALFTFLFGWDEFTWALTAIDVESKRTLPVAIAAFHGAHLTQWGLVFAASLIAMTPTIVLYIALQRYFVRGLTAGAIKG
ncbi:carbohydrate ABC transporter permease [Candidatus Parcubacteria bacterium]|nr:MAG: carbohydrate ABC transporter permease [Candidatus Parcubacteria bacterium]